MVLNKYLGNSNGLSFRCVYFKLYFCTFNLPTPYQQQRHGSQSNLKIAFRNSGALHVEHKCKHETEYFCVPLLKGTLFPDQHWKSCTNHMVNINKWNIFLKPIRDQVRSSYELCSLPLNELWRWERTNSLTDITVAYTVCFVYYMVLQSWLSWIWIIVFLMLWCCETTVKATQSVPHSLEKI